MGEEWSGSCGWKIFRMELGRLRLNGRHCPRTGWNGWLGRFETSPKLVSLERIKPWSGKIGMNKEG